MKQLSFYLLLSITLFAVACGGSKTEEEIQEEEAIDVQKNPLGALMQMGKNMEEQAKKAEERKKEAEANGEEVEVIHYEELIKYLPESMSGYERKEPTGGTMEMQGMSFSSAEVEFKKDNGNKVKLVLVDYNVAGQLYQMTTAMWASGIKIDTPEEKAMRVKVSDDINGWQTYKKKQRKASVVLGIGNRFLLTVEADDQDGMEGAMSIAKSMDLEELANL